ncbi:SDR family NAD(P)-dependent oxidoreductase [Svornostia abyssi]|uniref:SDR family NAD(P)-dependent oxidoreductase n=1 Tax=Svornostia abyssi TaxID=2898438 RepID=A0ABY5PE57_9ACTN|nr:SDR family NAD(P)-dependent oxidoreductase [Parviterribacteraceae bacterium J379]
MDVQGAGAVVFGGASGLGAATAQRLAAAGATVVVADLNADLGEALAQEIGGGFVRTDVRDGSQVQAAIDAASDIAGGLRVAVSCAGIGTPAKLVGKDGPSPLQGFRDIIEVNLLGTINVLRLGAASMVANTPNEHGEKGVLINTASVAAYDGQIGQVAYSASKGGIVGLTLPAARELARDGIRVVTIAPGLFNTPLLASLPEPAKDALGRSVPFPPRLGEPSEYAALAAHIVENPILNGEVIRLDGALRMAPK